MYSNCFKKFLSFLQKSSLKLKPSLLPRLCFNSPVTLWLSGVQKWVSSIQASTIPLLILFLGNFLASPLLHHLHQDHNGPRAI